MCVLISRLLAQYPGLYCDAYSLIDLAIRHSSIGVITPYKEQIRKIEEKLQAQIPNNTIEVRSVDGFQGREKDIIIFSTVRANEQYAYVLSFLT